MGYTCLLAWPNKHEKTIKVLSDIPSKNVKKGSEVAYKLEKKNYEKNQDKLYGDCPDLKSKFKTKKLEWTDLAQHIYKYTTECK